MLSQSCSSRRSKSHHHVKYHSVVNERTRLLAESTRDEEDYATIITKRARGVTSGNAITNSGRDNNNNYKNVRRQTNNKIQSVFTSQSVLVLIAYGMMALHSMGFDSLFPVFLHHPQEDMIDNPDVKLPFKFASGFGLGM